MPYLLNNAARHAAAAGGDPLWEYVVFLYQGQGSNGGTSGTDVSDEGHTITFNGGTNTATDGTAIEGSCVDWDGTNDITVTESASMRIGSGQFCVEGWFKIDASAANNDGLIGKGVGAFGAGKWALYVNNTDRSIIFRTASGTYITSSASAFSDATWHHFAVTRNSSNLVNVWLDGTSVASATDANVFNTSQDLYLGSTSGAGYLLGRGSQFRLTIGDPRYTSAFTPDFAELPLAA